jgi:NADPH:quinone reductase-like Zn-dependent oxidoreductase
LRIGPAAYTRPGTNEIVVRNRAVAINPIDWLLQSVGDIIFPWLRYPLILGSDVAGEVVEVGSGVKRFKVGDRILGLAVGCDKLRNHAAEGGFQHFTVLLPHMAAPIPPTMRFEDAAVLPLGLSTAACGLFQKDLLALEHPSSKAKPTGKTLIVWGGSTSVGSNAIQLAVAAGYEVVATASPQNFGFVRKMGAAMVFDYHSKTVVDDIVSALSTRVVAGAIAISAGAAAPCIDILARSEGKRLVALATPQASVDRIAGSRGSLWHFLPAILGFLGTNTLVALKARMRGVATKFIFGSSLMENEVSHLIYEDFLPQALTDGRYVTAPEPILAGHGLERINDAIDLHRKGVSARKVVVSL